MSQGFRESRKPSRHPDGAVSPSKEAESAVVRHVLGKGYLSREKLRDVQRTRSRLRAAGRPSEILVVLVEHVTETCLAELRVVHQRALMAASERDTGGDPSPSPSRSSPAEIERAPVEKRPVGTTRRDETRRDGAHADEERADKVSGLRLSNHARVILGAAALVGILGLVWLVILLVRPGAESGGAVGNSAVRTLVLEGLNSPPRTALPDPGHVLAKVVAVRGRVELPLLRDLAQNGPPRVRRNAAALLAFLGDAEAAAALLKLGQESDELSRLVALEGLGRLEGRQPVEELEGALWSERTDVRHFAIRALERNGSARAVKSLAALVATADRETRATALRALLAMRPALVDRNWGTRSEPATEIAAGRSTSGAEADRKGRPKNTSRPQTKPEVDRIQRPKNTPGPQAKPKADQVVSPKKEKAKKPAPKPKPPSLADMAKRDVPRLLGEGHFKEALAIVEKAIASLSRSKKDAELFRLRGRAQLGLGSVDAAMTDLRQAIEITPDLAVAYFDMAVCFGARKSRKNTFNALVMALRLGFRDILALRSESRLEILKGHPQFHSIMDHYFFSPLAAERDDEKRLAFACKRLQKNVQSEQDPFVRALSVVQFPEAGGLEATQFLCRFLKDRSEIMRRALAVVIGRTRTPESIQFLSDRALESRGPPQEREALMWTLDDIPGSVPLQALLSGLEDRDIVVQLAAAEALGDRPDRHAVPALFPILEKAKPLQRLTVAEALGKITGKDLGLEAIDWQNWWDIHGKKLEIGPVRNPCNDGGEGSALRTVVIPPAFSERMGDAKKRALARHGGTRKTEIAVARGLEWLARHQDPDGRWNTDEWALRCGERKPWERVTRVRHRVWDIQVTGLALMAFLGAGQTHLGGKYHDTVRLGIEFLKKHQQPSGYFAGDHHHSHRSHEIATTAITEAYLMTRDCKLRPYVDRAVGLILRQQHPSGGWGWHSRESLTTFTGWNLLALKTASQAGASVPVTALVSLRRFLDLVTVADASEKFPVGHAFESLRPAAQVGESLTIEEHEDVRSGGGSLSTAVGLWCRTYLGQDAKDPCVLGALTQIRKLIPRHREKKVPTVNEWLFFATQSAFFQGGETWTDWNKGMKETLIGSIVVEKCERGSWPPSGDLGRVYSTAMAVLLLESYYRFRADAR